MQAPNPTQIQYNPYIPTAELIEDASQAPTITKVDYTSTPTRENLLFRAYVRALARASATSV